MTFKATYQPNLPNTFLASRASPVNAYSYTLRKLGEERSVILPTASPRSLLPLPEPLTLFVDNEVKSARSFVPIVGYGLAVSKPNANVGGGYKQGLSSCALNGFPRYVSSFGPAGDWIGGVGSKGLLAEPRQRCASV